MGSPVHNPTHPDLPTLMAATTYLMTRYALQSTGNGCACQAAVTADSVRHHLEMLLEHPEVRASSVSSSAYRGLLFEWRTIVARHKVYAAATYEFNDESPADNDAQLPGHQNLH